MLNTPVVYVVCKAFLPSGPINFTVGGTNGVPAVTTTFYYSDVFTCIACGLWSGLLIGFITEYYTSHSYKPVREVAESCRTGAATNIIYGLALGMQSTIVPVLALAVTVCISFKLASQYETLATPIASAATRPFSHTGRYGVAMAALGMLSTLAIGLTIDGYGPISDNAGGIAEMCHLGTLRPFAAKRIALRSHAAQVPTSASAPTPSTPPATPLPPSARASPSAPLPSCPRPLLRLHCSR